MTDLVIFGFGLVATLMTTGAIGLLLYGAHQDGEIDRQLGAREHQEPSRRKSM
jgi:hypothetical protein